MQVLLLVFGLLPYGLLFIRPNTELSLVHNAQGQAYSLYRDWLMHHPAGLAAGSFLLMVVFSTYLFWVNIQFEIIGQRTVLVSYVYFFLVSIPLYVAWLHPGVIAEVIIFAGLVSIFNMYGKTGELYRLYNAGILFGLACILYPPFLLLLPVYVLAIARMKQPELRDLIILLLGFLTVAWIYGAVLWLNGNLAYEWFSCKQWFQIRDTWPVPFVGHKTLHLAWLIWILLLFPMALSASRARKDAGRRVLSVLMQFLWIAPGLLLVFERVSFEIWPLVSLPLAILFSLYVMNARQRWLSNLIFFSFIVFLILFQIARWL